MKAFGNIVLGIEESRENLGEISITKTEMGHVGQQINDDLQKPESSKLETIAGGEGFES